MESKKSLPVVTDGVGGYECGYNNCRNSATLAKCAICCGSHCPDIEGCSGFCLEWFGGKNAIAELGQAADGLQNNTISDPNERAEAVNLIEKMQNAKLSYVKDMAIALAKTTPNVRLMN